MKGFKSTTSNLEDTLQAPANELDTLNQQI